MPATGSYSREQISTQFCSGRSYQHDGNRDRMHIGTIVRSVGLQAQHSRCLVGQQYGTSGGSDSGQAQSLSISRSVDRRHTGTIIWLVDCRRISTISIVIAGIAALSVYRWYMAVRCGTYSCCFVAVRCQYRVSSVGRSAWSLVIGLLGCRVYQL